MVAMVFIFFVALLFLVLNIVLAFWSHQVVPVQGSEAADLSTHPDDDASTSYQWSHPALVQERNQAVEKAMEVVKVSWASGQSIGEA